MNEARLEATDHVETGGEELSGNWRHDTSQRLRIHRLVDRPRPRHRPRHTRRGAGGLQRGRVGASPARRARPDDRSGALVKKMASPAVSLRRIGECLKHMIALGGVMAFKSSGW